MCGLSCQLLTNDTFQELKKSTFAVGPQHLKVKEQDTSLTKNYCITINIKTISSIHIFIFKIQVSGSHELKTTAIFDKAHPKTIKPPFSLPAFVLACKKSGYFICSVLRYSQF